MSLRAHQGIQHEFRIVDAERFRNGSGHECVLLECGHRFLRVMPRDKDVYVKCPKEHDISGRRLPWDCGYIAWSEL